MKVTTFKEYKENIYLKNIEEIVINKEINIKGKEILVLSFMKCINTNQLWTVEKISQCKEEEYNYFDLKTNREDYRRRISNSSTYNHIHLTKMEIQDKEVNFTSSQSTSIEHAYGNQVNIIRHFIKSELLNDKWDDIEIENIMFGIYEQSEDEDFPQINFDEKININLNIDESSEEILIEHPLKVRIGDAKKDNRINYKDSNGVESFFYLDEIIKYDLHKDTLEKIEKNIEYVEEEQRQNYIDDMMENINRICPKDKDAVSIYYETEDNTQLVFHTKEKLESRPVYDEGCAGMIWLSDETYGINGYHKYVDMLCPVEKDFDGELEIELFSKHNKLPSEEISFEI